METKKLDQKTKLIFENLDEIPVGIVISSLRIVNDAYFLSEIKDLKDLRREVTEISDIVYDAIEIRMRRNRDSATLVLAIDRGSVEIMIVGTGLLIEILKLTIGETIKDIYRESDLHKKIKNFLLGRRSYKRKKIKEVCKRGLERNLHVEVDIIEVDTGFDDYWENADITCHISYTYKNDKLVPRRPDEIIE